MEEKIKGFLDLVKERNGHEAEFIQAVEEVANTGNLTVIKISHIEDPTFNGDDADVIVNTETYDLLIINTTNGPLDYTFTQNGTPITYTIDSYSLFYNGERMNSSNIRISRTGDWSFS